MRSGGRSASSISCSTIGRTRAVFQGWPFSYYNPSCSLNLSRRVLFMKRNSSPFKWRHYAPDVILLCVRWYCRFQLSYHDIEEMMRERGLEVDYSTVFRWVQRYAPEINKRIRPHLKMSGTSYRVNETYIEVGKHVNICIAPWTKKATQLNLCSARSATFPRQNGSSRS
jgi:hypothetical protein